MERIDSLNLSHNLGLDDAGGLCQQPVSYVSFFRNRSVKPMSCHRPIFMNCLVGCGLRTKTRRWSGLRWEKLEPSMMHCAVSIPLSISGEATQVRGFVPPKLWLDRSSTFVTSITEKAANGKPVQRLIMFGSDGIRQEWPRYPEYDVPGPE